MKKMKWTMFKKMFIVMLLSFTLINIATVTVDYCAKRNEIEEYMNDKTMHFFGAERLSRAFSMNNYKIDDPDFFNIVNQNIDESDLNAWFHYIVVNKDYQMIYASGEDLPCLGFEYRIDSTSTGINSWTLRLLGIEKEEENIEKVIREAYAHSEEVNIRYILENDEFVYLEIEGMVIVGEEKLEDADSTVLNYFRNSHICYDDKELLEYEDYYNSIISEVKNRHYILLDVCENGLSGYHRTVNIKKDLLSYNVFPLLKNSLDFNYESSRMYSTDDFEGYVIAYNMKRGIYSSIMEDVIYDRMLTFVLSAYFTVVVCLVVAYSFSRRIVDIEKVTSQIIDGNFDINLKVDTSDEIGSLANNINVMSQKIKEQFNQINDELDHVKKLEGMKSEFIANFTHEMKTPLSIINGYIDILDECNVEDKKETYLEAIHNEIDKINELVSSMLSLSRLQSGNVELNVQLLELDELIASCLDEFYPLIKNKKIKIFIDSDSSSVLADEKEMCLVLRNFISNAIKHTDHDGKIVITAKDKVLYIENEGSHIDESQMEKIWDTYVSGDREGTGLGLAINKAILDLHQFGYDVYNTDKGVCFKVMCKKSG